MCFVVLLVILFVAVCFTLLFALFCVSVLALLWVCVLWVVMDL